MTICIKQHLSNIYSLTREKVNLRVKKVKD